jgi:hypothetical protein
MAVRAPAAKAEALAEAAKAVVAQQAPVVRAADKYWAHQQSLLWPEGWVPALANYLIPA